MDYSKKYVRNIPRCLECGEKINYGRTDKKYCCDECRNRYHNHQSQASRNVKRRVLSLLEKNYQVLDVLVRSEVEAIRLTEAMAMGFNPNIMTSCNMDSRRKKIYCFDISYVMTANRLSSISKIQNLSLNLQARPGGKD